MSCETGAREDIQATDGWTEQQIIGTNFVSIALAVEHVKGKLKERQAGIEQRTMRAMIDDRQADFFG